MGSTAPNTAAASGRFPAKVEVKGVAGCRKWGAGPSLGVKARYGVPPSGGLSWGRVYSGLLGSTQQFAGPSPKLFLEVSFARLHRPLWVSLRETTGIFLAAREWVGGWSEKTMSRKALGGKGQVGEGNQRGGVCGVAPAA